MLLVGGTGMYDDNRQILADLLEVLSPGESRVGTVGRWLSEAFLPPDWQPGWITRIAFVAPKLDTVHPKDRDRMVGLLRRMVGRQAADRDGLRPLFTNCCAVRSTQAFPGEAGRVLLGSPLRGPDGRRLPAGSDKQLVVSELPDDWPTHWPPPEFHFPEVHPRMPPRKDCPPEQVNLDRVLTFLLDAAAG
jgi:predicted YcjX-like family ATPase